MAKLYVLTGTTVSTYVLYENHKRLNSIIPKDLSVKEEQILKTKMTNILLVKSALYGLIYPITLYRLTDPRITHPFYTTTFKYQTDRYSYGKYGKEAFVRELRGNEVFRFRIMGTFDINHCCVWYHYQCN